MMPTQACSLTDRHCVPCEGGIAALTPIQVQEFLFKTPGWTANESFTKITRNFEFKGYNKVVQFFNAIVWMAQQEGHHPDAEIGFGYCRVHFSTHAIGGLSDNDFICAAKVNALVE